MEFGTWPMDVTWFTHLEILQALSFWVFMEASLYRLNRLNSQPLVTDNLLPLPSPQRWGGGTGSSTSNHHWSPGQPASILRLHRGFCCCAAKSLQSCPTLCDPRDGRPPVSPVPGILQARTLEWVAISFSNAWKWKVKVKSLSRVRLLATPWTAAYQAPPSIGFSRQEYWSGVPLPSPIGASGHLINIIKDNFYHSGHLGNS